LAAGVDGHLPGYEPRTLHIIHHGSRLEREITASLQHQTFLCFYNILT
jgi:hypothetical protein